MILDIDTTFILEPIPESLDHRVVDTLEKLVGREHLRIYVFGVFLPIVE